jgi:hypothetical protein
MVARLLIHPWHQFLFARYPFALSGGGLYTWRRQQLSLSLGFARGLEPEARSRSIGNFWPQPVEVCDLGSEGCRFEPYRV